MKSCDRSCGGSLCLLAPLGQQCTYSINDRASIMTSPARPHSMVCWGLTGALTLLFLKSSPTDLFRRVSLDQSNTDQFTIIRNEPLMCRIGSIWWDITWYQQLRQWNREKKFPDSSDGTKETADISLLSILIPTTDKSVRAHPQWSNDKACGSALCFSPVVLLSDLYLPLGDFGSLHFMNDCGNDSRE